LPSNGVDWLRESDCVSLPNTRVKKKKQQNKTKTQSQKKIQEVISGPYCHLRGLPCYGYVWTLKNPNDNAIGAPGTGPAITPEGDMSYKKIKAYIQENGAAVLYNPTYVVKSCTIGSVWIGFDDAEVVKIKVSYAKQKELLGYVVWQVPFMMTIGSFL
jgi:GH18 family chitinase